MAERAGFMAYLLDHAQSTPSVWERQVKHCRDIDAIHKEMKCRHPELRGTPRLWYGPEYHAACVRWGRAWDAEPEMHERERALYLERGNAQAERDQKAYYAAMGIRRSDAARRAALTRKARKVAALRPPSLKS